MFVLGSSNRRVETKFIAAEIYQLLERNISLERVRFIAFFPQAYFAIVLKYFQRWTCFFLKFFYVEYCREDLVHEILHWQILR